MIYNANLSDISNAHYPTLTKPLLSILTAYLLSLTQNETAYELHRAWRHTFSRWFYQALLPRTCTIHPSLSSRYVEIYFFQLAPSVLSPGLHTPICTFPYPSMYLPKSMHPPFFLDWKYTNQFLHVRPILVIYSLIPHILIPILIYHATLNHP